MSMSRHGVGGKASSTAEMASGTVPEPRARQQVWARAQHVASTRRARGGPATCSSRAESGRLCFLFERIHV